MNLSEEQILQNTKGISNQDYLLTLLLADGETKHRMYQGLSEQAKKTVRHDLKNVVEKLEAIWK